MPIYEYRCQACGHEFEEWQKISEKPVRKCPTCGVRKVERLVSVSSFHLKGGGWYRDGYGSSKSPSSGAKTPAGSSSDGKSSSSDSKGTSSDSKSTTKTKTSASSTAA